MNLSLNDEYTTKLSDKLGYKHDVLGNGKEKLVEPVEMAGPNYRDTVLVVAKGAKPTKLQKRFAFHDQEIQNKMK